MICIFASDIHFGPEEDLDAWGLAVDIIKSVKPNLVCLGGDVCDFYSVSSYEKDPLKPRFESELAHCREMLAEFRESYSGATWFLVGNHEERYENYIRRNAPALATFKGIGFEAIMGLGELDIEYYAAGFFPSFGRLLLCHGHKIRTGGQNPARSALLSVGDNVLFGHVHRATMAFSTSYNGETHGAWSNSCLSSMRPEYRTAPDWTQGITIVETTKSGHFAVTPVIFWRHQGSIQTIVGGKHYTRLLAKE
jgi:predicted phosphodiesterase